MPPPYPLHGSGPGCCWSAFPGEVVLRSIQNRFKNLSFFFINFGPIFGPIWEPFWTLFGVKNRPSSIKMSSQTLSASKMWIFTKPFKNQWNLMIFDSKIDPKTPQDGSKTGPRGFQKRSFFIFLFAFDFGPFRDPFWVDLGSFLDPKIGPKSSRK